MSLRVGLGASQADLDVQGEIDFDFFEESDGSSNSNKTTSKSQSVSTTIESKEHCPKFASEKDSKKVESESTEHNLNSLNIGESFTKRNFNKPMITVSCDDATGEVKKTTIETVIPTPYTYKDNKCGKLLSSTHRINSKSLNSPRLKNKAFKEDTEISDDSSLSSMSGSESLSSESEDSFELEGSDSMTDVTPICSPYAQSPKAVVQADDLERALASDEPKVLKKEGVKFEDAVNKQCQKCDTIDFHELVSAMNRLQMKQNGSSISTCSRKCISPVLTHNARCRKNLSFTNEKVRKIDSDNQILLKKIVAQQHRPKSQPVSAVNIRCSSAVNRQRQQRQIELENLALLKRLETTKPSKSLSRSHLLRDFDRRAAGVLSRSSSRSSYPNSSRMSSRASALASGRSSAISIKSSNTSCHSPLILNHSSSTVNKI